MMNTDPTDQGARFDTDINPGTMFRVRIVQESQRYAWEKFKETHREEDLAVWRDWCHAFADILYETRLAILRKTGE